MQGKAVGAGWGPAVAKELRTAAPGTRVPWRRSTSRGSSSLSLRTSTGTESRESVVSPPAQTLSRRSEASVPTATILLHDSLGFKVSRRGTAVVT